MRKIIENQRKERNFLLSRSYVTRQTKYCASDLLQSKQIKLITGPRRVGKSTEALLLLRGRNFAYLNFDDQQLLDAWNENAVYETLQQVYPNFDFLLLDEVQNLPHWDVWVAKLYRLGVNMVVTGSNARLLSGEMASLLTGRYVQMEMLPFSLSEFFAWHKTKLKSKSTKAKKLLADYLQCGGYPETLEARPLLVNYLSALFDSIVLKDVAQRHKVRKTADLGLLASYLLSNFCNAFSINTIAENLGFTSVATVQKFMNYLSEPYLFFYLSRYNSKLKLMKKAPQKVYVVDNGFVAAKAFSVSDNFGRLLENQVFVELVRCGYSTETSLFYYRSRNDKEVDFVMRNGTVVESLVQVCYDLEQPRTLKREVDSLVECAGELHCKDLTIVTMNDSRTIEKDGYVIKVVPISTFSCDMLKKSANK